MIMKCKTCNGLGIVGGFRGQTPENYEEVIEDCPDCSQLKTVSCKCEVCDWIDDFTKESLNIEQCVIGFCEDCDQERIFILIP